MPIARNRPFIRVAADTAAATPPPPARIASAANCAEPAKTSAEVRIVCNAENPACRARTPNDIDSRTATTPNGTPSRSPARKESFTRGTLTGRRQAAHPGPARRAAPT
jgi:hypothetical protein